LNGGDFMSAILGNYSFIKMLNSAISIIALLGIIAMTVKLFKGAFINHYSSESFWRNARIHFYGIAVLFICGFVLAGTFDNEGMIVDMKLVGKSLYNGLPYRDVILKKVMLNFKYLIVWLTSSAIFYFLYVRIAKKIRLEVEEIRRNVVHKRL